MIKLIAILVAVAVLPVSALAGQESKVSTLSIHCTKPKAKSVYVKNDVSVVSGAAKAAHKAN